MTLINGFRVDDEGNLDDRRPDPLQLPETAGPDPERRRLSQGEKVGLGAVIFFATYGVLMWSLTLPAGTQFAAGVAWGLLIAMAARWAELLDA